MNLFFSLLAAFLPAIFWLVLFYKKDAKNPEPKKMIFRAFFFGGFFAGIFALFGKTFSSEVAHFFVFFGGIGTIFMVFFFAAFEEISKFFAVVFLGKQLKIYFDQIIDGVVYALSVALGFAFVENAFYFFAIAEIYSIFSAEFFHAFAGRALFTTLGHALFSGIFGLFWGHAFLSQGISPKHNFSILNFWKGLFRTLSFHVLRCHIFPRKVSDHGHEAAEVVAEGLLAAAILHGFFNLLLDFSSFRILIVPLLFFLFWFLSSAFHRERFVKILHPVLKNDKIIRNG